MDTTHAPTPAGTDLSATMLDMGARARAATKALSLASAEQRTAALTKMAAYKEYKAHKRRSRHVYQHLR